MPMSLNQLLALANSGEANINAYLNNAYNAAAFYADNGNITPSGQIYENLISSSANCDRIPGQSPVHIDKAATIEFAKMFLNEIKDFNKTYPNATEIGPIVYLAYMTTALNKYLGGKIVNDNEYSKFMTQSRNLSEFKGQNKSTELERALMVHNFNKLLGVESNLIYNNGKVFVMYDDIDRGNDYSVVFYPGCYLPLREMPPMPSVGAVSKKEKDILLYTGVDDCLKVGSFEVAERAMRGPVPYRDPNFIQQFNCMHLTRKHEDTRERA